MTKDPPERPPRDPKQSTKECYRCGGRFHDPDKCRYKEEEECYKCRKKGHKASQCLTKGKPGFPKSGKSGNTHHLETTDESGEEECEEYTMFHMTAKERENRIEFRNGVQTSMEVDTGAAATIINEETYKSIIEGNLVKNRQQLETAKVKLQTYTGELVKVIGTLNVIVKYEKQEVELQTLVVEGSGPNVLGRDWLRVLTLSWKELFKMQIDKDNQESSLEKLVDRYSEVFREGIGTFKGQAKIHVESEAQPKFLKVRPVPYAMTGKIEAELKRLRDEGTIEPVQFSEWNRT